QIWKDLIYLPTLAIGLFYIVGIARLVHLRISGTIGHVQGKRVILHPQIKSAFTFFWVFIPDPNCDALIVEHEELHQRRLHSLDNLIMALLLSVLWWNPVLWFFSRWIKETHELEVDEILDQKDNSYREVLIKNALLKWNLPLAQPFALKSQIINRIAMMKKERKMKSAWTRAIWITGVTAMITLLVNTACSEKETAQEAQQLTPVENQVKGDQSLVEMKDLDVNPEFPGGNLALSEYLGNEIKYPKAVEADQLEGTVFVEFVVDKTGKVRDAKVKKGFATEADEEALRVISNMPNWEPGKKDGEPVSVAYTIPIKFSF
ncbi:MAG: M56 family metallopeptidase, partial [Luteibaculum sp.]